MDELKLTELIRTVIREELIEFKQEVLALKQGLSSIKQDVSILKVEVEDIKKEMITKAELMNMEQRFTTSIEKITEALKLSLHEIHDNLEEIRFKMKFYDFDFFLKQNDHLAGVLKDILEERKSLSQRMRDFEERLKLIEAR